jgi:hypothetical protein
VWTCSHPARLRRRSPWTSFHPPSTCSDNSSKTGTPANWRLPALAGWACSLNDCDSMLLQKWLARSSCLPAAHVRRWRWWIHVSGDGWLLERGEGVADWQADGGCSPQDYARLCCTVSMRKICCRRQLVFSCWGSCHEARTGNCRVTIHTPSPPPASALVCLPCRLLSGCARGAGGR